MNLRSAPFARLPRARRRACASPAPLPPRRPSRRSSARRSATSCATISSRTRRFSEVMTELEKRQQETQKAAQAGGARSRATRCSTPRTLRGRQPVRRRHPGRVLRLQLRLLQTRAHRSAALIKSDPKLRVVLKDFPVLGPDSVEASRVALAVKQPAQGREAVRLPRQAHGEPRPGQRRARHRRRQGHGPRRREAAEGHGVACREARRSRRTSARRQARPLRHAGLHRRRGGHLRRGRARAAAARPLPAVRQVRPGRCC